MEVLALKMKNNIKERRKARGLRQEDMAKLLGVSRQTIVAMERNNQSNYWEALGKVECPDM
jgi:putative transcriptional regulator